MGFITITITITTTSVLKPFHLIITVQCAYVDRDKEFIYKTTHISMYL